MISENKKSSLFKSYLKYSYKGIIELLLIVSIAFYYRNYNMSLYLIYLISFPFSIITGYFKYKNKLDTLKKLKAKGLTIQDLDNIEFVKKWEETRKEGLWKYCIRDGGIITGAGLSLGVALLFAIFYSHNFVTILADPGSMFSFIGYSYIGGACAGVILFRITWHFNEKRFIRLTDPFNTQFTFKKSRFYDPLW